MSKSAEVLVFSPPHKKEIRCLPSEFLLLKPFSKAPSLQIELPEPGRSKATLLSVQNIDDTPSRLYFEIPAGKPLQIKPETAFIQPQSVELFEIIAVEPQESFRASVKVFAPDIKFYRGGQVNVIVTVKQIVKAEKKKKPKAVVPNVKPKAVTVPKEFQFQPSREQRKKGPQVEHNKKEEVFTTPSDLTLIGQTFNLDDIRKQTQLIKRAVDVNQTYLIPPKVECDPKNPVAFVKQVIERDRQNVSDAIFKFLDFAKSQKIPTADVSEYQRQEMNKVLLESQSLIQSGNLAVVFEKLSRASTKQPPLPNPIENNEPTQKSCPIDPSANAKRQFQMLQKPRRSSQRTTSSPKRESCDMLQTPEKLSGISSMTLREMVSNYLPDTNVSQMGSITVESPDVSAIFPLESNNL